MTRSKRMKEIDRRNQRARTFHNCNRKRRYYSIGSADAHAREIGGSIYYCVRCAGYHVTTKGIQ